MTQSAESRESDCREREELARRFSIAARLYAEAVVMLTRDSPGHDYRSQSESTARARERCEVARLAFEQHLDSHHCIR